VRTVMRRVALLAVLVASGRAGAQSSGERSLFLTVPPQVSVVVRKHQTGADMVFVTMLRSGYPEDLLRSQLQRLGELVGDVPRGLAVARVPAGTAAKKLDFLKAEFAVSGLIDRQAGKVRLEPIVKAFAGAPEPYTIRGMMILLDGEPLTDRMIGRYEKQGAVRLEAMPSLGERELPAGVEYRVELLAQDPSKIVIPDSAQPATPVAPPSEQERASPNVLVLILGAVAALAVGVLVYLALLRRAPAAR